MNQIFKTKRNALGQFVVCSELTRSHGKIKSIALAVIAACSVMTNALAVTTQGENQVLSPTTSVAISDNIIATGDSSVAIGDYVKATGNESTSVGARSTTFGNQSTATGSYAFADGNQSTSNGYAASAMAIDTIAIGVNSGAVGGAMSKETFNRLRDIDKAIKEYVEPKEMVSSYIKSNSAPIESAVTPRESRKDFINDLEKYVWGSGAPIYVSNTDLSLSDNEKTWLSLVNASQGVYQEFTLSSKTLDADFEHAKRNLDLYDQNTSTFYDRSIANYRLFKESIENTYTEKEIQDAFKMVSGVTDQNLYAQYNSEASIKRMVTLVYKLDSLNHFLKTYYNWYKESRNFSNESIMLQNDDWVSDDWFYGIDDFSTTETREKLNSEYLKIKEYLAQYPNININELQAELTRVANAAGFEGTFESLSDVFGAKKGRAIAIGNQAYVSGDESVGVGYGNTVTGSRSNVLGTHNNVTKANNNVMGNDNTVTVSEGNVIVGNAITFAQGVTTSDNIALGSNTVISAPVPTASMNIRGTTYNFAGTTPTSVVTVGSEGHERQIQNVAAGRVTETSTDAVNGSQLYAVASAINSLDQRIPTQIADAIASDVAWSITTSSSEGGNVTGNAATEVANGDTVTFDAGKNINITQTGQTISIATSDTPTFNNVTINEAPTEGNHAATKDYVDNGRSVVEAGDNVKVKAQTDDATGKTTYTVSADVPTTTITKGDNVAVSENVDDSGNKTYIVNADKSIVSTTNDSGLTVTENEQVSNSGATTTTYSVELSDDTKTKLNKEESVTAGSDNLTVTKDSTNDTGGKNFVVNLAKNINLTEDGSLTIGNVKLSSTEVNAGGNVINNIAKGVEDADAVNVAQLKDSRTKVVAGSNVKVVESEDTNTGALTYTINVQDANTDKSAVVKAGNFVEVTTSQEANDGITEVTGYTVNVKTGSFETSADGKLKAGDTNGLLTTQDVANAVNETYWTVDVTGNTQNVKNGDTVKFGNGEFTEITLNDTNDIVVNVKADGKTIINKDGSLSVNLESFGKTTLADGKNTTVTGEGTTSKPYEINAVKSVTESGSSNIVVNVNSDADSLVDTYTVELAKNINLTPEGSLTIGDIVIEGDTINAGGNKITNVANGTAPTDAVNVSQLNAAKTEVKAGENVQVSEEKGANGQSIYTVSATGDLTNITSIANGDTKVSLGDGIVNVEGNRITNVASPVDAGDVTNKDYVDNSRSTVTSTDGTISVVKSVVNATTGAVNYDLAVKGGLKVATDNGKVVEYKLGDTLTVTGDNKNISTVTTSTGATQVKLADDVKVNSITTGNVSISTAGVNAGGKKVTNVAPATISPTSTDAVNGSQLYATNQQLLINSANINRLGDNVNMLNNAVVNLGDRIESVEQRVGNVENKVNRMERKRKAGTASAIATAGLMQAHRDGQSGVTAAVGQYQSQTAIALGYSRLSDNGKYGVKLSLNANTQKEVGGAVGVGYFW